MWQQYLKGFSFVVLAELLCICCKMSDAFYSNNAKVIKDAIAKDFPNLIATYAVEDKSKLIFKCSGLLISSKFVLTTDHCLMKDLPTKAYYPTRNLVVANGISNAAKYTELISVEERISFDEWRKQEQFPPDAWPEDNDIALLKLKRPIINRSMIYPKLAFLVKNDLYQKNVTVVGYGGGPNQTKAGLLKYALTTVQNAEQCKSAMRLFAPASVVDNVYGLNVFCTRTLPRVTVNDGDSGGPVYGQDEYENCVLGLTKSRFANSSNPFNVNGVSLHIALLDYILFLRVVTNDEISYCSSGKFKDIAADQVN